MRPCPKCGQGAPAGARFCPACGSVLEDAEPAQPELRKVVTVVFCDLSGSTGLGERLDPESVRGVVTRFFDATKAALEHHGGTVEKFIGDAVMAVFGVPVVHEDDALRAVRAVNEMRTALEQLNEQLDQRYGVRLRVRTGVNTGEVIAGDPTAGHGFVSGDAVNVAARLEQAAGDGEVLLGEATAELVRDAVEAEPAGELELKGRGRPVRAFRLAGVRERGDPGRLAPLVGRERELALLREALERSGDRCELVTLLGAAGLGKSRLVAELESSLDGTATVVTGRCLSYGEGLTFWPVREVVEALAGVDDADSLDEAQAALERLLSRDDERDTIVARLAGAVGLTAEPASPAEIAWAVRRVVESAAAERGPLVVVFDDAHWGEGTFLDLVEYLARTVEGPVLLLLVAREDVLEKRPALAGARVELAPLSEAESRELVGHLAGEGVSPELTERALSAGEGNPLFVEELVRMLAERPGESVPPTLHALLAARIEELAPDERALAEAASVVGRSFGPEAAFGLVESVEPERLAEGLRGLESRGLVQADGGRFAGEPTFSFRHILIRDVAYQGILKAARAHLHERFADWLEQAAGERAGEYEEILGHHLERACAYLEELGPRDERGRRLAARAAARLGASGRRALAREDVGPAVRLLERALALTPEDDPGRRDLSLKLGLALAEAGELSRADALLDDRLRDERRGRAFVVFSEPGGRRQVIDLAAPATTVGRHEDSHVKLAWDSEVSRRHAELRPEGEGWVVVDRWSRNGSYLNGERVEGERALRDGDVLRFGDTVVQFQAPGAAERKAASLDPGQATIQGKLPGELGARLRRG